MNLDYPSNPCKECGSPVYRGGIFCSRVCEDSFIDKRIKFDHSRSGVEFEEEDLPTVEDVQDHGTLKFKTANNLRESLIKRREDQRKARIKVWEEMRRLNGI